MKYIEQVKNIFKNETNTVERFQWCDIIVHEVGNVHDGKLTTYFYKANGLLSERERLYLFGIKMKKQFAYELFSKHT